MRPRPSPPAPCRVTCARCTAFAGALALVAAAGLLAQTPTAGAPQPWLELPATGAGVGAGLHLVFVTGDEEYRSEESMPQLAAILAQRHGARCTVLFAVDPKTGAIDPGVVDHIPGLAALRTADVLVLFTRFRDLPDDDMQRIVDFVEAGKPVVALRTSTHAFAPGKDRKHRDWGWDAGPDRGGFGRRVLGETWVAHHGQHGAQGTRGALEPSAKDHPVLRGVDPADVWDPADVYTVREPLPEGCAVLLRGLVLQTMAKDAPAVAEQGRLMPLAWTRMWRAPNGRDARVFTTTLGAAEALTAVGTRRLLCNAILWAAGREQAIAADLDVALVGDYAPRPFGFGRHRPDIRPAQLAGAGAADRKPERHAGDK